MLKEIIKAYLYQQYKSDDNLQAFFTAYNSMSQEIYDWVINANLPIFTGNYNYGSQLEWIAHGIYGQYRPIISSSKTVVYGPYNTIKFNQVALNGRKKKTTTNQITTSDDIFKRVMTWNFYKGDGFNFTITWLKRRILRFLQGVNGADIVNDQRWGISITFGDEGQINITIIRAMRSIIKSAQLDDMAYGDTEYGALETRLDYASSFDYATVFKTIFDNGLLNMPFWSSTTVTIAG